MSFSEIRDERGGCEGEKEKETHRDTERYRETQRHRDRDIEIETE